MDSEWRITFRMSASGLGSSRTNQLILLQLNNKDHQFLYVILSSYGSVGNAHMLLSQLPDQNLFIAQPPGHTRQPPSLEWFQGVFAGNYGHFPTLFLPWNIGFQLVSTTFNHTFPLEPINWSNPISCEFSVIPANHSSDHRNPWCCFCCYSSPRFSPTWLSCSRWGKPCWRWSGISVPETSSSWWPSCLVREAPGEKMTRTGDEEFFIDRYMDKTPNWRNEWHEHRCYGDRCARTCTYRSCFFGVMVCLKQSQSN